VQHRVWAAGESPEKGVKQHFFAILEKPRIELLEKRNLVSHKLGLVDRMLIPIFIRGHSALDLTAQPLG
jgi:hypothetical protein